MRLEPKTARNRMIPLSLVLAHKPLVDYVDIGNARIQFTLSYKLETIFANILRSIDYDDPKPLDLVIFALDAIAQGKTKILDTIINTLGLKLEQLTTTDPCSSTYVDFVENKEIKQFIAIKMRKRQRRYRMKYGGYEEIVAWGILIDNDDITYLAKLVYDHSYDFKNSTTYAALSLLPITEKLKLRVTKEETRVVCGPDGYANKYTHTFTYVFPPA